MNQRRYRASSAARPRTAAGFTLIEMLVAVLVASMLLVALLGVFDLISKLARAQTEITDVQQSLRSAQYDAVRLIRMAGRGPLPARTAGKTIPRGLAVEVINNVPADTRIGFTENTGPPVLAQTDILVIRGVFGSSLYQINHLDPSAFTFGATGGTVTVADRTPTGVPQDLSPLLDAVCDNDAPEALVLVSPLDDSVFAVVELDPSASRAQVSCAGDAGSPNAATISFKSSGGAYTASFLGLSPAGVVPETLTSVAFLGILEEHRFYIREVDRGTESRSTPRASRFSRARVYPGSDAPYLEDPKQWQNDIADNIFELQVALGIDANDDGIVTESGDSRDEWLFNHPDDDAADSKWNTVRPGPPGAAPPRLYHLRLTTIARASSSDRGYQAPVLDLVEDHSYSEPPSDDFNLPSERTRRQRRHETLVDMRNIS